MSETGDPRPAPHYSEGNRISAHIGIPAESTRRPALSERRFASKRHNGRPIIASVQWAALLLGLWVAIASSGDTDIWAGYLLGARAIRFKRDARQAPRTARVERETFARAGIAPNVHPIAGYRVGNRLLRR